MFRRLDAILALGALIGAAGCSDPVPPPNKVGLHLRLAGAGCSMPINKYLPTLADAPSTTLSGNPIENGKNGFRTSCTVSGGGTSYSLAASIATPALGADTVSFNISGSIAGTTGSATSGSFYVGQTTKTYQSTAACTLSVITTGTPQIQPGSAWLIWNCPSVRDVSDASGVTCSGDGELMLADCKQ